MKPFAIVLSAALAASAVLPMASTASFADDGEKVLKRVTGGSIDNQLNVLPQDVGLRVSEAEHAFTDMMKFYVPAQKANGSVGPIDYNNIDGTLVESLDVAKPLVNVFLYGPAIGVEGTPFAHSYMEAFAAVSLDDGLTWKTTNLSQSADLSSFTLGQIGGGGQGGGSAPGEDIEEEEDEIDVEDDDEDAVVVEGHHGSTVTLVLVEAEWSEKNRRVGELEVEGFAEPRDKVTIINYTTGETLFRTRADEEDGEFEAEKKVRISKAPCMVAAVANGVTSAPIAVEYDEDSEIDCVGADLTEYPGGAYNVVHAVAGNKVLVAWPSRFCQQGQPAFSFAYDGDDSIKDPALVDKRNAIASHLGIDVLEDLYLTDLFEVAGQQRSIDFADEDFPQVGEVPFGCVWTSRGVLLAGDDPRTSAAETTHMVWTKPERLTSGRRDPNRIEVKGVKGAGFALTWQEDPDGLRPGQGLGPGEGWSGAVAHDKTDIWYSFVSWEQFDQVENQQDPLAPPINIVDHDLSLSGKPQVFVPMAVPMRLTNNDKCVPDVTTLRFSYCNYDVAQNYGLQDFCADTVNIPQGQQGALGPICVNQDGLPNVANTAATRARLSLQGYDSDGDGAVDSAWVVVATEESKGLGRFSFLPDGSACLEGSAPECEADIGKNQWYFSFDMGSPDSSATMSHANGLVQNLVRQGNLLNQPEVDWRTGEFYPVINTSEMWDFGTYNFDLYNTEIARRASLLVQPIGKAVEIGRAHV